MAAAKKTTAKPRQASREGKRFLGGYFSIEFWREISTISVQNDKTIQELSEEAFRDLVAKYRAKQKG